SHIRSLVFTCSLINLTAIPPYPRNPSSFFFMASATTQLYTLSLHDALPISDKNLRLRQAISLGIDRDAIIKDLLLGLDDRVAIEDRKSTRLNSSHLVISYAVFCLKKKNTSKFSLFTTPTHPYTQLRSARISC